MATYSIKAPNGQTYQIEGPDGATDDQVRAEVLRQHPDAAQTSPDAAPDGGVTPPAPDQPPSNPAVTLSPTPQQPQPGDSPASVIAAPTEQVWGDQRQQGRPNRSLTPDQEAQVVHILSTAPIDQAAGEARAYLRSVGWNAGDNFDEIVGARRKTGTVNEQFQYNKPAPSIANPSSVGSGAAGIANSITLGVLPKTAALLNAVSSSLGGPSDTPSERGFMNNYNAGLDQYESDMGAARDAHPFAYYGGELVGGAGLPSGVASAADDAALSAGREILRAGGSMKDARTAALAAGRRAATIRMTQEGAGYGAGYGALSADTPQDAASGGALGALGGVVLGNASRFIRPKGAGDRVNYAELADQLGVQPTPATVGGVPSGATQLALSSIPGGAQAVGAGTEREIRGLGDNISNLAASFGESGTPESTGEALSSGAASYRADTRKEASDLYKTRDQLIGGDSAPVAPTNFTKSLADTIANFGGSEEIARLRQNSAIAKVADAISSTAPKDDDGFLTMGQATEALSYIRGVSRQMAKSSAPNAIKARVDGLKTALESDVYDAAKAADTAMGRDPEAPGSAVQAQKTADAYYAQRAQNLEGPLGRALKHADDPNNASAESVYTQLARDTDIKGGNLSRLRQTWFLLPKETQGKFSATLLDDMGRPQASARTFGERILDRMLPGVEDEAKLTDGFAWSPETFLTNFNKMNPAARRVVFGKEGEDQILAVVQYASRMRKLGKLRNFSNTAMNAMAGTALVGVASNLLHGHVAMAGAEAAAPIAAYAGAKLFLATPAMRKWTLSMLKTSALKPEKSIRAQQVLVKSLSAVARAEPQIANEILGLKKALSDAIAGRVPLYAAANQNSNAPGPVDGKGTQDQPQYEGAQP